MSKSWFSRMRTRKGYGVHPPYAYELITEVIRKSQFSFYAYKRVESNYAVSCRDRRFGRMLVRLVSFLKARRVLLIGQSSPIDQLYIKEAVGESGVVERGATRENMDYWDLICIGDLLKPKCERWLYDSLNGTKGSPCCLIVKKIRRHSANGELWQRLLEQPDCRLVIDAGEFGILFLGGVSQKETYYI